MTSIYQKKAADLTAFEQQQIISLLKRHYPNVDTQYIEDRISSENEFDIVVLENDAKIVGVSYFKLNKLQTPFSKRKVFVIQFGQVIKDDEYQESIIWKLGHWYANKNIGYLYPLKRVVGITITSNPKVYSHFDKLFSVNFGSEKADHALLSFLNDFISAQTNLKTEMTEEFTVKYPNLREKNISADWERFYRSKNEQVNELFRRKGIININDNGEIVQTLDRLVCVGYRDVLRPIRMFKR